MNFDVISSNGVFPVTRLEWVTLSYCSEYIAPNITETYYWGMNDGDGLNADQARQPGAALQSSLDNGSIDKLARELFVVLCENDSVFVLHEDHCFGNHDLISKEELLPLLEREYVNNFISEVKRWIEFVSRCDGFTILCNDDDADNLIVRCRRN